MPKVSVIIPCFNLGRYLGEAVDSVLAQTMRDFEIVVVDDGSTDGDTGRLLSACPWPKTRVIRSPNRGLSAARNLGIGNSGGGYICCLDADDILEPDCLGRCAALLDSRPEVGVATFWYRIFGEKEAEERDRGTELADFLVTNRACGSSPFRREAWEKAGGYDETLPGYEDWDFWIGVLEAGYRVALIPEFLFRYRVRKDSMVRGADRPEVSSRLRRRIIEKHLESYRRRFPEVLIAKDDLIARYRHYWKTGEESLRRLTGHHEAAKRRIEDLERRVAGLEARSREAERERATLERRLGDAQHRLNLASDELRGIKSSRPWPLACAICAARHSLKGLVLLPFRVIDVLCPRRFKRVARRLLLVPEGDLLRRGLYRFPYRLAARLAPDRVKRRLPIPVVNAARRLFGTGLPRLFRLEPWEAPLVTVVIPCHNYGRFLDEALESALGQTLRNIEIIIVDDGSDDPFTVEKLAEIERRGIPNLMVRRQENQGVSRARNNAIAAAWGKYICCLDADDRIMPAYLKKCVAAMEARRLDISYSWVKIFGDEDREWGTEPFEIGTLTRRNCVPTAAVFTKEIWRRVGGFNPNMAGGNEDWDFWLSVAEAGGRGEVIPAPLFHYRRHGVTRDARAIERHAELMEIMKRNHPSLYGGARRPRPGPRWEAVNPLVNLRLGSRHDFLPQEKKP
ncbi:MAG: glycosyltransferase [bacterium]|nr:glycosyltransferase [bacterium]